jgi:hypothetical protein
MDEMTRYLFTGMTEAIERLVKVSAQLQNRLEMIDSRLHILEGDRLVSAIENKHYPLPGPQ